MQARCPRCASIFTTDRSGLQFCPNCGQQVDVPAFPGAPPEGTGAGWGGPTGPGGPGSFGPGAAVREDTPWERRATVGWWNGFFETWKRVLFSPQLFWPTVKPDGSWTDAVLYAWLIATVAGIISAPFSALGFGRFGIQQALDQMGNLPPSAREAIRNAAAGGAGFQIIIGIILFPLFPIIGAAILHLFCMLFGVAKNGYFATLRVVGYALSTSIVSFVPCIATLAWLYCIVLVILGLSSVQEATVGRAAAAALVPMALVCCCFFAAIILGAGLFAAAMAHAN